MSEKNPTWFPHKLQLEKIVVFVLWFSRWEYALKNSGYHKNSEKLEPNWEALINELSQKRIQVPEPLMGELKYLRENPVRQQFVDGSWREVTRGSDWECLLRSVTTVRNNLLHGGKHVDGPLLEPARDEHLIDTCQKIMIELVQICPQFQDHFN